MTIREPIIARPTDLDDIPDRAAVFLLWAAEGTPYLARTALLGRRLTRLLSSRERVSRVLSLSGVVERIEYWLPGSQIESALIHLELARRYERERYAAFRTLSLTHSVELDA